jgi:hypothetical protein
MRSSDHASQHDIITGQLFAKLIAHQIVHATRMPDNIARGGGATNPLDS